MKSWAQWSSEIARAVESVPDSILQRAAEEILAAEVVLTAGNGGSSALASHAAQAIAKPAYKAGGGRPAFCLTDNRETLTAHANDGGWPDALLESAKPYLETLRCTVVVFSSSGKSENVVRLALLAVERGQHVVSFTGFDGGPLRELSTVSIHVDSTDYEVIEPVHDALLHRAQAHLRALQGMES